MTAFGRYLFAVTRGLDEDDLTGLPGLRRAPVQVVACGSLQAVVCDVPLDEFGEDALVRNLEDLSWVEEVARSHDLVIRAVAERATVAPMRLVTIYASDDRVRTELDSIRESLTAALDRVEGASEWAVKVYAATAAPREEASPPKATSGMAYLQQKRQAAEARRTADDAAAQVTQDLEKQLAEHAVASRRLALQDPRLSGRSDAMVLNAAYLVPDSDADAFAGTVAALTADNPGVTIEAQGPWPPYSFTMLD